MSEQQGGPTLATHDTHLLILQLACQYQKFFRTADVTTAAGRGWIRNKGTIDQLKRIYRFRTVWPRHVLCEFDSLMPNTESCSDTNHMCQITRIELFDSTAPLKRDTPRPLTMWHCLQTNRTTDCTNLPRIAGT